MLLRREEDDFVDDVGDEDSETCVEICDVLTGSLVVWETDAVVEESAPP